MHSMLKPMKRLLLLSVLVANSFLLSGCLPVIQSASTVSGAVTVVHERRSAGEVIDDKTIALQLLTWSVDDAKLADAHVNFMSFDRVVLVTGEAPSTDVRDYIIRQIPVADPKVERVINEITIGPKSGYLSRAKDAAITTQIEVFFHDQEVFHPTHVKVMTEGQTVYLMGQVTQREGNKATKIAAKAKGVKKVVKLFDYLKARPAAEIERDKQRELEAKRQAELAKERAAIEAKKAELRRQLRELGDTSEGTPF